MSLPTADEHVDHSALAADLRGALHLPGEDGYTALVQPWNSFVPSRPTAIAAVADADDVAAVVRWAGGHDVPVTVRATGHGAVDPLDGMLLVHTGALDSITITDDGTARVGAGVTWGALATAAAAHGYAPHGGSAPTVGVVGLLTGGGLGPLSRTHGVCSDRVRSFDLVTGDGTSRHIRADEEPDLFWGLRGGKGALGIVTAIELDLLPNDDVFAGALFFDGADTDQVLHAWAQWSTTLPSEATTSIALTRLPDLPQIPRPIAGRLAVSVRFACTGDESEGRRLIEPMQHAAPVIMGGVQPMPAAAVGGIHGDPVDPTPTRERSASLNEFPSGAVDAVLAAAGADTDCSLLVVEIRQLGGAIRTDSEPPSAFPGRDVAYALNAIGLAGGPLTELTDEHAAQVTDAVNPWSHHRRLPNFEPTSHPGRLIDTYGADSIRRLAELADRYDPRGVIATADPVRAARALASA